jgi:hypothetical protein
MRSLSRPALEGLLSGLVLPEPFQIAISQFRLARVHVKRPAGDPHSIGERADFERIARPENEIGHLATRDAAARSAEAEDLGWVRG